MAPQPFVPLADGAQVEIIFNLGGQVVENRLWFLSRQPPVTTTQLQALSDGVRDWHEAFILPFLSSNITLLRVEAIDWTSTFPVPQGFSPSNTPGGNTSGVHSANVSIRVLFKGTSSQTFPSNSNFVPGIPLDEVNQNRYTTNIRNALFEGYVALIDLASGFGPFPAWRWVITSRRLNNAWRTTQESSRTDFIRFPSPIVSPRRKRLP